MRTEKQMFDLILQTAKGDDRIRAVILNGSRANPNARKDIFQDYDIVYVVTETASFIQNPGWIRRFGEPLIFQFPDELDKIAGKETHFDRCYGYLMQFADGNRIDLHIETPDFAAEGMKSDTLSVVLLDKDGVLPERPAASDKGYWVKMPTAQLFARCCNEYRWVSLYVAKGLWRNEAVYALDCQHFWARPQLFEMLAWYAGLLTDFSCSIGKSGKNLSVILPQGLWERYLKTYSNAEIDGIWRAALTMGELFEETARKVGKALGFAYDEDEAQRCLSFVRHIRDLPADAESIV